MTAYAEGEKPPSGTFLIRKAYPGRLQMGIFEKRNKVFTLLVFIAQAHASLAEDAHPSFCKWASSVHR
jgi:hypothetical protein